MSCWGDDMKFRELSIKWKALVVLLSVLSVLLVLFNVGFGFFLNSYRDNCAEQRDAMKKEDADLIGQRLSIPRKGNNPVAVNIYVPDCDEQERIPVVFNIHGGGFVAGDADALDTQSNRCARQWNAVIVSVNYTTADVKPISYGVKEITNAVQYFYDHAEEYHVNPEDIYMIGYSAGAYYAAEAAKALEKEDCHLNGLILCYPWTTGLSNENFGNHWPETLFILAGRDPISQKAKRYIAGMKDAGLEPDVQEYSDAQHSFIESNNPEGMNDPSGSAKKVINAKQEQLAREAELEIGEWINHTSGRVSLPTGDRKLREQSPSVFLWRRLQCKRLYGSEIYGR